MGKNSFKDLESEYERSYNQREDRVHKNLQHNVGIFQFVGNLIELYFPKMFGAIFGASPSSQVDSKKKPSKYPNE